MRRTSFTVDAESVQGNAGASVTFRKFTVGERDRWVNDPAYGDLAFLSEHILDWSGIEDDEGNEIPSPRDEQGVTAVLYMDEASALLRLLLQGPNGENAKN